MTSSTLMSSRFSKTVATGIRVSLNTHAPLTLPGMLSTAGHWDQSRIAMFVPPFIAAFFHNSDAGHPAAPLHEKDIAPAPVHATYSLPGEQTRIPVSGVVR